MGTLGVPEMAVIFILALVLFGPSKLPELGRTIGKAMTEFRRASNELKATFDREMHTLERENQSIQDTTREAAREIADATYHALPEPTMWNPLEEVLKDEPASIIEPAPTQETATVGASEVSGAELPAASAPAITPAVGTVPRSAVAAFEKTLETTPEPLQELAQDHGVAGPETHQT